MTRQYLEAARTILEQGTRKENRTGVDTISTFDVPMRFDLREGFPLLTTKKVSWWNIVAENLWFLSGEPHIGFLKKHGVKFWDAWADEDGNVPSAYGNFWRRFPVHGADQTATHEASGVKIPLNETAYNDQIKWVVEALRKDPTNRRLVVSAWAPGNAQTSKLPPCHVMYVLNTQNLPPANTPSGIDTASPVYWDREDVEPSLCLKLTQRSCDMFLGVPYNIAGYAFITHVLAHLTGLKPGILGHSLVDAHFYTRPAGWKEGDLISRGGSHGESTDEALDHIPQVTEQLTRAPRQLPKLTISDKVKELDDLKILLEAPKDEILDIFKLEDYDPHGPLKGAVAV
jgi:thymidylate synthase